MLPRKKTAAAPSNGMGAGFNETLQLEKKSWRTWELTVWVAITITLGLAGIMMLVQSGTLQTPWPWEQTQRFLLVGLAVTFLSFLLYSTHQQRHLSDLRRTLYQAQRDSAERVKGHLDRLVAIMQVSKIMASASDPETVLSAITESCLGTFNAHRVSLMLLDRETRELVVRAASGRDDQKRVLGARIQMGQGVAGFVAEHRRPVILGETVEAYRYPGFTPKDDSPMGAMVVPIMLRDELVGVLNVTSFSPGATYTDGDVQALMVFGEHAGICCRHAEQSEWMRQTIRRLDAALTAKEREKPARAA